MSKHIMAIWRVIDVSWFMPGAQYERWSPWHEIYSTYQFMGYGLTEHDMYPKAPKYL